VAQETSREERCRRVIALLRAERQRQGLSMERLAEMAGISTSMVSLIERHLRNPTLDTLFRISDALKVDLSMLISKAKK
jgi:transcriptional regulator with XRE-family HTH domain